MFGKLFQQGKDIAVKNLKVHGEISKRIADPKKDPPTREELLAILHQHHPEDQSNLGYLNRSATQNLGHLNRSAMQHVVRFTHTVQEKLPPKVAKGVASMAAKANQKVSGIAEQFIPNTMERINDEQMYNFFLDNEIIKPTELSLVQFKNLNHENVGMSGLIEFLYRLCKEYAEMDPGNNKKQKIREIAGIEDLIESMKNLVEHEDFENTFGIGSFNHKNKYHDANPVDGGSSCSSRKHKKSRKSKKSKKGKNSKRVTRKHRKSAKKTRKSHKKTKRGTKRKY